MAFFNYRVTFSFQDVNNPSILSAEIVGPSCDRWTAMTVKWNLGRGQHFFLLEVGSQKPDVLIFAFSHLHREREENAKAPIKVERYVCLFSFNLIELNQFCSGHRTKSSKTLFCEFVFGTKWSEIDCHCSILFVFGNRANFSLSFPRSILSVKNYNRVTLYVRENMHAACGLF